jgi:hypothetical protein
MRHATFIRECGQDPVHACGGQRTDVRGRLVPYRVRHLHAAHGGLPEHLGLGIRSFRERVGVHEEGRSAGRLEVGYVTQTA